MKGRGDREGATRTGISPTGGLRTLMATVSLRTSIRIGKGLAYTVMVLLDRKRGCMIRGPAHEDTAGSAHEEVKSSENGRGRHTSTGKLEAVPKQKETADLISQPELVAESFFVQGWHPTASDQLVATGVEVARRDCDNGAEAGPTVAPDREKQGEHGEWCQLRFSS